MPPARMDEGPGEGEGRTPPCDCELGGRGHTGTSRLWGTGCWPHFLCLSHEAACGVCPALSLLGSQSPVSGRGGCRVGCRRGAWWGKALARPGPIWSRAPVVVRTAEGPVGKLPGGPGGLCSPVGPL